MRTGHQQSQVSISQNSGYKSQSRNFRWNKGARYVPHYLIAVREEVGDECAHAQLIADRFSFDTEIHPYQHPAKRLKLFRRVSHGWQPGLSSSGLLLSSFSMLWTKTEDSLLGEERNRRERWPSGKVAKAS
jgi:hypothetical protein